MRTSKRKVGSPQLSPNEQSTVVEKKGPAPPNEKSKSKTSSPPKAGSTQLTLHGSKVASTNSTGISRRTKQEKLDGIRKLPQTPISVESDNEFSTPPEKSNSTNEDEELDRVIGEIQKHTNERRKSTPNRSATRTMSTGRGASKGRGSGRGGRGKQDSPKETQSQTKIQVVLPANTKNTFAAVSENSVVTATTSYTETEIQNEQDIAGKNLANDLAAENANAQLPIVEQTAPSTPLTDNPIPETPVNENDNQATRSSLRSNSRYSSNGASSTPVQTNLTGAVINKTRYTMNFKVTSDQRGTAGLSSFYTDMFKEMKSFCADTVILPWNEEIHKGEIKSPEEIPTTITKIKQYFYGARTHDAGGSVFSKVHLGFPITADRTTFESDFISFCKDRRITFYKTAVQHHNVKTACWLPYLTPCTNTVLLSKIMTDSFRATTGKSVPIGCVNRYLNSQRDTPEDEKVRAIRVECPSDSVATVKSSCVVVQLRKFILEGHDFVS